MKDVEVKNFVKERIRENEDLFTVDEIDYIRNNEKCVSKIYLLGFINSRQCYKENKSGCH